MPLLAVLMSERGFTVPTVAAGPLSGRQAPSLRDARRGTK
jgi:hypothetical protein